MKHQSRIHTEASSHWYTRDGNPFYEIAKKDGSGMRSPRLADARKLDLIPSVTTILSVIDKPALNDWKAKQVALAIMTTKQNDGEDLDSFFDRVITRERVHEQEAMRAREVGSQIHEALQLALTGQEWDKSLQSFVNPVLEWQQGIGKVVWTEKILVGEGYAGRADALLEDDILNLLLLLDFKTTSSLPDKASWPEHQLQTSAYAMCLGNVGDRRIITGNVYISTKKPGYFSVFTQDKWPDTYKEGFIPALQLWCHIKQYWPGEP